MGTLSSLCAMVEALTSHGEREARILIELPILDKRIRVSAPTCICTFAAYTERLDFYYFFFCAMAQVYDYEENDLHQETEEDQPWYRDQLNISPFQLVGKF